MAKKKIACRRINTESLNQPLDISQFALSDMIYKTDLYVVSKEVLDFLHHLFYLYSKHWIRLQATNAVISFRSLAVVTLECYMEADVPLNVPGYCSYV